MTPVLWRSGTWVEVQDVPGNAALATSTSTSPGEIRALVGQNGCGKSTLIKILAGFHEPEPGGSVQVEGNDAARQRRRHTAGLRFVHQDLGLVDTLDAVDNLALGTATTPGSAAGSAGAQARRAAGQEQTSATTSTSAGR